ncbi:hypothetical protein KAU51_05045 [Candidatus Parcubacteria bacterium]|nr:hypothetical protein [Candidatus Parcubacteria bacterium]
MLIFITVSSLAVASDNFCGCIERRVVDEPLTVAWTGSEVDGYELKIVHYFYTGLETDIVDTINTTYTFNTLPKSSRHFEIQVRAFNNKTDGTREYSVWALSSDKEYAEYNNGPCGWLIFTVPGTPSW